MRAGRDAEVRECLDDFELRLPALELDHLRLGQLDQFAGVVERLLRRIERAERHVEHQQRVVEPGGDRAAVVGDVVERDRNRRFVALDHHAERIADQHDLDAALLEQARETVIVGRQAGEFFAVLLQLLEVRNRDLVFERFRNVHGLRLVRAQMMTD